MEQKLLKIIAINIAAHANGLQIILLQQKVIVLINQQKSAKILVIDVLKEINVLMMAGLI